MEPVSITKKPVTVQAMQWDGTAEGATPIIDWVLANGGTARYVCSDPVRCSEHDGDNPHYLAIETLEGMMRANPGYWVIRGVKGEFYPCKPDILEQTYDIENGGFNWRRDPAAVLLPAPNWGLVHQSARLPGRTIEYSVQSDSSLLATNEVRVTASVKMPRDEMIEHDAAEQVTAVLVDALKVVTERLTAGTAP